MTNLPLFSLPPSPGVKITQLYEHLELFSEGEPPRHTLFVLGRPTLAERNPLQATPDQLLIIDPPANVSTRFRVEGNVATLFTGPVVETGFPLLQTEAGGVAHIRIGEHYLDLYSQPQSNVIQLPALGVLVWWGLWRVTSCRQRLRPLRMAMTNWQHYVCWPA